VNLAEKNENQLHGGGTEGKLRREGKNENGFPFQSGALIKAGKKKACERRDGKGEGKFS